jgi:hypothetical protein
MQKKYYTPINLKFVETAKKIKFWSPVERNGWIIKFSVNDDSNILIFFLSRITGQLIIRYFENEDNAVKYINFICNKDPSINFSE